MRTSGGLALPLPSATPTPLSVPASLFLRSPSLPESPTPDP